MQSTAASVLLRILSQLALHGKASAARAKTAELIEMPVGIWTRVGSREHVLSGGCTLAPSGEYH